MSSVHQRKFNQLKDNKSLNEVQMGGHSSTVSDTKVLGILLTLRLTSACLMHTYFVPDETWQSTEVAHKLVFGYGFLTWEWIIGLRSYIHPLIFASLFYILHAFGLDTPEVIILSPRIIQAVLSTAGEWYFYLFIKKHFDHHIAVATLMSLCLSWCWFYCGCRTLINSVETVLTCVAVYLYPWTASDQVADVKKSHLFTFVAGIALVLRPTTVVAWAPLYLWLLLRVYKLACHKILLTFMFKHACIALSIFTVSIVIDRWAYGRWVFVHYNFLHFNVLSGKSIYFGRNDWHWYITQGIPIAVATHLPFTMHGIFSSVFRKSVVPGQVPSQISKMLLVIILATTVMYSTIGHKEFRFILNILPFCCFFAAISICSLSKRARKFAVIWLAITNVPMALYFSIIHQSGPAAVLSYLRQNVVSENNDASTFALFLMPCHSTPYYSHLHSNVSLEFLTCHEDLKTHGNKFKIDEDDQFYNAPQQWIHKNVFNEEKFNLETKTKCDKKVPRHIVLYDSLWDQIGSALLPCYKICFKTFHTHFPEHRTGKNMLVLCRSN